MNTPGPARLDKHQIRRAFERAAATYDEVSFVQRKMADELIERLDIVKIDPRWILDAGCGTGYLTRLLAKRYPKARVVGLDLAVTMVALSRRQAGRWLSRQHYLTADLERSPFAAGGFDMVVSNACVQWCDLDLALAEFARVLRAEGLLMFASFGPDTLTELRSVWAAVDDAVHVHDFLDMHDVGDALLRQQFTTPVMDVDRLTVTYRRFEDALRDLKHLGSSNAAADRSRGLLGKARYARLRRAAEQRRNAAGLFECTYEIVYGHGFAPTPSQRREPDGAVAVPLSQLGRA